MKKSFEAISEATESANEIEDAVKVKGEETMKAVQEVEVAREALEDILKNAGLFDSHPIPAFFEIFF